MCHENKPRYGAWEQNKTITPQEEAQSASEQTSKAESDLSDKPYQTPAEYYSNIKLASANGTDMKKFMETTETITGPFKSKYLIRIEKAWNFIVGRSIGGVFNKLGIPNAAFTSFLGRIGGGIAGTVIYCATPSEISAEPELCYINLEENTTCQMKNY